MLQSKPGRAKGRLILLIAVLAAAGFAWSGYHKTPLPAAQGDALDGLCTQMPPAGRPLRIGTFNINGCCGADDRYDLERTADALRGCDLVGLCEVHGRSWKIPQNQARLLGEKVGLSYLFAPAERRWWHDDFGNGILGNLPVIHWQQFPMSTAQSKDNRALLLVRAKYAGQILNVLIVHVEGINVDAQHRHGDAAQLREVVELFASLEAPAILLGDLNTRPDDPLVQGLLADARNIDAIARIPDAGPRAQGHIDWIVVRGLACIKAGLVDKGASDHPFYWADLEWPQAPSH
jgi:endonuclease/exonuclease/phosphatase family metal-dependent hydrolase